MEDLGLEGVLARTVGPPERVEFGVGQTGQRSTIGGVMAVRKRSSGALGRAGKSL